jgi:hypothetical protein
LLSYRTAANIAPLMLDAVRTQTTLADAPAEQAGRAPDAASWPDRTRARVEHMRHRAMELGLAFTLLAALAQGPRSASGGLRA